MKIELNLIVFNDFQSPLVSPWHFSGTPRDLSETPRSSKDVPANPKRLPGTYQVRPGTPWIYIYIYT